MSRPLSPPKKLYPILVNKLIEFGIINPNDDPNKVDLALFRAQRLAAEYQAEGRELNYRPIRLLQAIELAKALCPDVDWSDIDMDLVPTGRMLEGGQQSSGRSS